MDRDRDGGQRWVVREWRALTLLFEWKVLASTLNPRTPMANLISSIGGGASTCRAAQTPSVLRGPRATRRRLVGYGKLL
jgi:hypothetical protein